MVELTTEEVKVIEILIRRKEESKDDPRKSLKWQAVALLGACDRATRNQPDKEIN